MIFEFNTVDGLLFEKCQATAYCILSFDCTVKYAFVFHAHTFKCLHILFGKILNLLKCLYAGSKITTLNQRHDCTIGPPPPSLSHNMCSHRKFFLLPEKLYYDEHLISRYIYHAPGDIVSKMQ